MKKHRFGGESPKCLDCLGEPGLDTPWDHCPGTGPSEGDTETIETLRRERDEARVDAASWRSTCNDYAHEHAAAEARSAESDLLIERVVLRQLAHEIRNALVPHVVAGDPAPVESVQRAVMALESALRGLRDRAVPPETQADVSTTTEFALVTALRARVAAQHERILAYEAVLDRIAEHSHGDQCSGLDERDRDRRCDCGVGPSRDAIAGGTSALDAALAKARAEALDDVAAKVGALTHYAASGTALVWESDVLAAIDAARKGGA